ncbi:LysR family transcriptional regulator [Pandoraea horticolens]|uniref:LysR family transcriptional regulator n=1 Tax=Pandoraea horticolens TaxID=2508298 RepID=A0A5E4UC96_9BURK|nr:LysR substrate-binding domain-containing protein [Pandoraea horticolens]VVD97650.1 LysR family transcriptional regulator [Pandoraea horticolens]
MNGSAPSAYPPRSISPTDANTTTPPFEHFYLSLQAAGAGLGAAIGSVYMVSDELNAGRLVAPFGFARDGSAYVALAREPFAANPAREALLHWLRSALAESASKWISRETQTDTR